MRVSVLSSAIFAPTLLLTILASPVCATSVPRLTFEQLTDQSELVVSGEVVRTWSAWDSSHHHIWTHHEVSIGGMLKGAARSSVVVSEPGGVVGGLRETIVGSVRYEPGDKVVVFLERMPNGYLRTTGWSQGRYTVDPKGLVHGDKLAGTELVSGKSGAASLSIDGMTAAGLRARVTARVRSAAVTGAKQ